MLSLEDTRWKDLHGGYGVPYDVSIALRSMQRGKDVWEELWNELHHQGDIGDASYAAVPQLVSIAGAAESRDWHLYGLLAIIEVERHQKGNPPIPAWLQTSYDQAWARAFALAASDLSASTDSLTIRAILSVLALAKGELKLGALLSGLDSSELDEWLEERHEWSGSYEARQALYTRDRPQPDKILCTRFILDGKWPLAVSQTLSKPGWNSPSSYAMSTAALGRVCTGAPTGTISRMPNGSPNSSGLPSPSPRHAWSSCEIRCVNALNLSMARFGVRSLPTS